MSSDLSTSLRHFAEGGFVIVTDDAKRENEGDLFLLAEHATTEKIAFMIRYTSGVICVPMTEARSRELHLPLMVKNNQDTKRTAFTVTVDVKHGITTGISAEERANTIRALADSSMNAEDFIRPGHIFPLVSNEGGLRARQGHTEAIIEMCRRVGAKEVGVISELVNEDGSMMRGDELMKFARDHQIPIVTIAALMETLGDGGAKAKAESVDLHWAKLPLESGEWQITTFTGRTGVDHAVMRFGQLDTSKSIKVRIHSECVTGDIFGSLRCDCGDQLDAAIKEIVASGSGAIVYLRDHEGRGIGLSEKIRAYELQDQGLDTVDANLRLGHEVDERDFADAVEIIKALGISSITLLTNNPEKAETLSRAGIATTIQALKVELNPYNEKYVKTKQERLGHLG